MSLRAARPIKSLFTGEEFRPTGTVCHVCGHRTAPLVVRYSGFERVFAVLALLLALYVVADFVHDGQLNGSVPKAVIEHTMASR